MKWETIDTAPKDGSYVFLRGGEAAWGSDASPIVSGQWIEQYGSAWQQWVIGWSEGGCYPVYYDNPTHWASMECCL